LRSRISWLLLGIALLGAAPSVADVDANSRAGGSDKPVAVSVGRAIFTTMWPVQVLQVVASGIGHHVVVGMRLSGVKFHQSTARNEFDQEVLTLVQRTFAADPLIEEVDLWVTVPIDVGKGLVVSGDLAKPAFRTVFTVSVRRGEAMSAVAQRLQSATNVFIDREWAATAFAKR
jgi:hypothetical protein